MIGARCTDFSQSRRIHTIHKLEHTIRHIDCTDKAILLRDHSAQFRQKLNQKFVALFFIQRLIFLPAKSLLTFIVLVNILRGFFRRRT